MQGDKLDTLAQFGTGRERQKPIEVAGNGSSIKNHSQLLSKAKRKIITQKMILSLVDVAKRKGKPEMKQQYWNTWHCQIRIYSGGSKIYGKYCKNRICTVCLANRKAHLINKYYPILQDWNDAHFLTITIKSIPAKELPRYTKGMIHEFSKIVEKYRKRYNRGKGIKLIGIRSFECNFNPVTRKYNPHFHVIVASREMAGLIKMEWMKRIKGVHSNPDAQHIRKVQNLKHDLIEAIKYGSKIFTEPDIRKKSKATPYVFVSALDNILTAMIRRRIFQSFGIPDLEYKHDSKTKVLKEYDEWQYESVLGDWVNHSTGDFLTGYKLDDELQNILNNNLDMVTS